MLFRSRFPHLSFLLVLVFNLNTRQVSIPTPSTAPPPPSTLQGGFLGMPPQQQHAFESQVPSLTKHAKGQVIRALEYFLVAQHCCFASCKVLLPVLPPPQATCHATNLIVASCSNMLHEVELGSTFGTKLATRNLIARQAACRVGNTTIFSCRLQRRIQTLS